MLSKVISRPEALVGAIRLLQNHVRLLGKTTAWQFSRVEAP